MNKQNIKDLLCAMTLCVTAQTACAEIVCGLVVDAETKEPLPAVQVTFGQQVGESAWCSVQTKTDSLGKFTFFASGRGTLKAEMLGYSSKSKPVLAFSDSRKDTLDLGTIELKMTSQMLKMVEVKSRARRFTVRGDTIVFHPDAFHLQDGTRLDELIRQLPGVQVDGEGKLSWNGKPIRLTMDGERLLGGDELMKQLPAEAVESIKAYNKRSEFAERTGKDDGTQDMVLDLTVKPGFLDRWYGDVMAGYQSPKYYDAEVSLNRLSKTDPMMVYADANNVDVRRRRYMDGSVSMWSPGFGKEQGASAGYQHKWKEMAGTQELKSHYSFSGGLAHNDRWNKQGSVTENYLPNTAATRTTAETTQRNHELSPTLHADLRWATDTLNTFTFSAEAEHKNTRSESHSTNEQTEAVSTAGTAMTFLPTLSQLIDTHAKGHNTKLNTRAGWEHYIRDGALGASFHLNYTDGMSESQTDRTIASHSQSIAAARQTQNYSRPSTSFSVGAEAHHTRWMTKRWMVQVQYHFSYNRNRDDQEFLTNGMADAANSYHNLYCMNEHNLQLAQTFNLAPVQLMPTVTANWKREAQDYLRGALDTAAVRCSFIVSPALRVTWKLGKTVGFELNYNFSTSRPNILQTIGYRDLTDPLFVTEGNPQLNDSHTHDVRLTYNMVLARSQTSLSATLGFRKADREVTTALSYNPATAAYVSRPENVRGSRLISFRMNYDQGLGEYLRLQNDLRMDVVQSYGFLTLLPTQSERTLNRQRSFNPREKLALSFDKDGMKLSAFAEINADKLSYTVSSEQNTTHWNNSFGLNAEATCGHFVFQTRLVEWVYRGYTVGGMNRSFLTWDASVTWKVLKNKARLALELDDILNSRDSRYSWQSAYQQTTSWTDFRHHYVGFRFSYRLEK
ncbi:MAG: outer membrane beta-barrel protein [Bacteroidaceae bacterium]|nr:outer membrane beta-barrel protein [Bacteroidaceae bacterium]